MNPISKHTSRAQYSEAICQYLANGESARAGTVEDLIDFGVSHTDIDLPFGGLIPPAVKAPFVKASEDHPEYQIFEKFKQSRMELADVAKAVKGLRRRAQTVIDDALAEFNVDVLMGPAEGPIASVASAAGYPVGTVPLGFVGTDGRTFGVAIIARADKERTSLKVMSAWGKTLPEARKPRRIFTV